MADSESAAANAAEQRQNADTAVGRALPAAYSAPEATRLTLHAAIVAGNARPKKYELTTFMLERLPGGASSTFFSIIDIRRILSAMTVDQSLALKSCIRLARSMPRLPPARSRLNLKHRIT